MSKKPNLLRDALKSMRVNEPVRMSKAAPCFKPPAEPQKEVPLSESPPPDSPQKEGAQSVLAQTEPAHIEPARLEVPQIEAPRTEEPQIGLPQVEGPPEKESDAAFFRLSHRVFSDPKLQSMSGDCFRLFLWLASKAWRYPNSDGNVRAAITFIEGGTGMSHANVSRCLKMLRELGLVRLVQTDFKRGNIWWVSPMACPSGGGSGGRGLPKKEAPQIKVTHDRNGATPRRGESSLKKSTEAPRKEGEIKNLRKEINIKKAQTVLVEASSANDYPTDEDFDQAVSFFETEQSPDGQEHATKEFIARELSHGYLPPGGVLHRLVAYDWFIKQTQLNAFRRAANG